MMLWLGLLLIVFVVLGIHVAWRGGWESGRWDVFRRLDHLTQQQVDDSYLRKDRFFIDLHGIERRVDGRIPFPSMAERSILHRRGWL